MTEVEKIRTEYCEIKGYSTFNKYNINEYSEWLESKLKIINERHEFEMSIFRKQRIDMEQENIDYRNKSV